MSESSPGYMYREAQTWVIERAQIRASITNDELKDPDKAHELALGTVAFARYLDKEFAEFDTFLEARGVNRSDNEGEQ